MRPAPRYPLDYPVTLLRGTEGIAEVIPAMSFNLSKNGIGLRLQKPCDFKIDEEIRVSLQQSEPDDPAESLILEAKVIWQNEDFCGLKITKISERSRKRYQDLLEGFEALWTAQPLASLPTSSAALPLMAKRKAA